MSDVYGGWAAARRRAPASLAQGDADSVGVMIAVPADAANVSDLGGHLQPRV